MKKLTLLTFLLATMAAWQVNAAEFSGAKMIMTTPDGEMMQFLYDRENNAWMQVQNGEVKEMFRFNEDGTVKVNTPAGQKDVALDEAGLYQVQMAFSGGNFWACR